MELTLDLSVLTSDQRAELFALVESFTQPRYTPSADEYAEHSAPRTVTQVAESMGAIHPHCCPHPDCYEPSGHC